MNISDLSVGMKVIIKSSTHPLSKVKMEGLKKWRYLDKGYLIVCMIDTGSDTVWCWRNRIHTAWGRETHPERWTWLKFSSADLAIFGKNARYAHKIKKALEDMEVPF